MRGSFNISEVGLHAAAPTIKIYGTHGSIKIEFVPNGKLWYGAKMDIVLKEVKIKSQDSVIGVWKRSLLMPSEK